MTLSAAMIQRAMRAFEGMGRPVKAARLYPDGSVALLTDAAGEALPDRNIDSWVELAGEAQTGRA